MTIPVRESDFVGELCIALAHRWEPERSFMILTAYFDESGTHKGAELAVMAGFLGDSRQWRKFEKRAGKLFRRFGVDIFHSIDIKRTDNDFAGWSVDRKIEFLDEFQHIVNEVLEFGVASLLRYDDYADYKNLDWPKGTKPDSMYGILFRASLAAVVDAAPKSSLWTDGHEPLLNVVLEDGHRNAQDAVRLYKFFKEKIGERHRAFAGLTFAGKKDCLPLAAADLFAYGAYREEVDAKPIGRSKKPLKSFVSYRGNASRIELNKVALANLHEQAIRFANERWV